MASATTRASAGAGDYDDDNDGLIEVSNLAQLNAMRYDLDGDGVVDDPTDGTATTTYAAAFPNAEDNMGCNESDVTIQAGTGNPPCSGYELSANLDFDTNGDGWTDVAGDTYWNGGKGWQPIAHDSTSHDSGSDPFDTTFEGNNYVISNLFIDRRGTRTGISGSYRYELFAGLFGDLGSGAKIRNLGVEDVSVTFKNYTTSIPNAPEVYAGEDWRATARARYSRPTSPERSPPSSRRPGNTDKHPHAGGLIGRQVGGSITSSYARVTTTANFKADDARSKSYAGGLVAYQDGGDIVATYARGSAAAIIESFNYGEAHAGGLIGYHKGGEIKSSYSEADARATVHADGTILNPTLNAGGFVGTQDGGKITASYSTGAATTTTTGVGPVSTSTHNVGGLTGRHVSGATTNSYWDTTTSGITATGQGVGKTTSELQTPVAYGAGSSIYATWNLNLDGMPGNDDPWDFGTASDYPVLQYHLTIPPQRAGVTLTVSPTTIWERALTTHGRASTSTVTATLSGPWHTDVGVTPLTDAAYTLSTTTLTIAAGATTTTATLTAVNNFLCGTSACPSTKVNKSITLTSSSDDPWVSVGTAPSLTIRDDDELTKPTGLRLSVGGTKIRADWTAVADATGYRVQWNTTNSGWDSPTGNALLTGGGLTPPTSHTIDPTPALNANTRYYVRVLPVKSGADEPPSDVADTTTHGANTKDYDADDDGLIEVTTLAQLNAIRWDLNGDGVADNETNAASYAAAFPNAEDNMGCNESVSITSGPGNPACSGYELRANLDFDTGTKGDRTDDPYYNSGAGWTPLGDGITAYSGDFDGNNDSDSTGDGGPYAIANLHVNLSSTSGISYAGLFGVVGSGSDVSNVALTGVSVTGSTTGAAAYVGALAGKSSGTTTESWSLGAVAAKRTGTGTDKKAYAGGLVGWNDGTIRSAYSRAAVTAASHDENEGYAGGLVGLNDTGDTIAASYATGAVTANRGTDTAGAADNDSHAGGLAAVNKGTITASYAIGDGAAVGKNTDVGGLVAENASGASITASYSLGKQTATALGGTANTGGLSGSNSGTITNSYWDTTTSGITAGGAGTGKTISELQTPTTETGIYANWDVNVDGVTGNDDPWDFGTASQYPVLDFGSHALTKQRATLTLAVSRTTIWERADTGLSRHNTSVITPTLSGAWEDDLTVTLPSPVAGLYTLSTTTITFAAGSTTTTPASVTLTAVDDTVDQTGPDSRTLSLIAASVDSYAVKRVFAPTSAFTITINDDDNVAKVTGVKLSVHGTNIRVDWTAAAGATGYKVEWNTANSGWDNPTGSATKSGGSTVTHNITSGLAANTRYYVRVIAIRTNEIDAPPSDVVDAITRANAGDGDYDADNDGLIEITTLAQLNAIRYDLDGDGVVDDATDGTATSTYAAAFSNAEDNMGCRESAVSIASNNTGNPPCLGYELRANLDFNTNSSAKSATNPAGADSRDTYWNGGLGWDPIGGVSGGDYTGAFDGNADTDASGDGGPYTISNLFIDRTSGDHIGLFADLNGTNQTIKNVALVNVDVTLTGTSGSDHVMVGGLAGAVGAGGVSIEDSYVTGRVRAGESASSPLTLTTTEGFTNVGGLVGRSSGSITSSYSLVDVTVYSTSTRTKVGTYAGSLAGYAGNVSASYAGGNVSANVVSQNNGRAYAGGLAGHAGGAISASYARGDVSAAHDATVTTGVTGRVEAGGLVGRQNTNVTASFSTGAVTATGDGTLYAGGLVGRRTAGVTTNSYWDTETSGITATGEGAGKTTSQLQTPTAYSSSIYAAWNLNLDGVTGSDDPWDFGTASQYPTLKYQSQTAADQRIEVTLSVSPATIWERALTTPSRVNAATVTATLDRAWNEDVVVTLPTNAAYTLSAATVTIAAGATTSTATLTAVNNFVDAADNPVTLTQAAHPADTRWAVKGTDTTITIKDDDLLDKPTGVKLSVDGTKIQVDWTAAANADGYRVEWNAATNAFTSPTGFATISASSTVTYKIDPTPALTADTTYYVRVVSTSNTAGVDDSPSDAVSATTKASAGTGDYDADNDGLIEVTTLAQLNAIRWDLDGDGVVDNSANAASYAAAFSNAEDNMGCNESDVTIQAGTGNPPCSGYELGANLDFDTGTAGDRTGDTYYNSGQGWLPIGATAGSTTASAYTAEFDGGTSTISNLHIDRSGATSVAHAGLFAQLSSGAVVKNLSLEGVSVTVTTHATASTPADVFAGGIAGKNSGAITGSYVLGVVKAVQSENTANDNEKHAYAGGLVGQNAGSVVSSYSRADVTAEQKSTTASLSASAGGIAGYQDTGGSITASFSTGAISADSRSATGATSYAGGLLGYQNAGGVRASYSHASAEAKTSSTAATATLTAGGLVGHLQAGNVTASFSTGAPTTTGGATPTSRKGGLAGYKNTTGTTVTDAYWDTDTSGVTAAGAGVGTTTSQLKTPTAYGTGIYKDWDLDLDAATAGTQDGWNFGTSSQYPVLKYGLTPADQRATVTLTATPATICESIKGSAAGACGPNPVTSTAISASINPAQQVDVIVTLGQSASDYTLGAATITISAGSTSSAANVTATAVNNKTDASDNALTIAGTSTQKWVNVTGASLTIEDEDILDTPIMSLAEGANHTSVIVTWPTVTGADGYKLEWKLSTDTSWTSVSTTSPATISNLGHRYVYDIRLAATKTGYDDSDWDTDTISPGKDYDADDDGLIEITTLAQLNAIRWDLDGNGESTEESYKAAFPLAHQGMGCEENKPLLNRYCAGYELAANLDFNTNNSAASDTNPTGADSGDTYWNSGAGWLPIGGVTGTAYTAAFDGNNAAETGIGADGGPYTIKNLFINRTSGSYAGLFGYVRGENIWKLGVENVDITLTATSSGHVYVGGLAGRTTNVIIDDVYTTGAISATATTTAANKHLYVGGLAGSFEDGVAIASYSWADVTAVAQGSQGGTYSFAGGLFGTVGEHVQNPATTRVDASYAAGSVSATAPGGSGRYSHAGGLAGQLSTNATIRVSYARGPVSAYGGANAYEGGLVAFQRGNIEHSFATGAVAHPNNTVSGGLVGNNQLGSTVTASYYNSDTDGRSNNGPGTAKTTSELQTPTAYGTSIYKDWNVDLDVLVGNDDPWDFGTANQYPALKYQSQTAASQRPVISLTLNPATIYESVGGATVSTVTATSTTEWNLPLSVAVPQDAARYTVSSVSIAEGSTRGTQTLTAINNKTDAAHYTKTLTLAVHPAKVDGTTATDTWVSRGTSHPTLTINDDDELAKPTGLKLSADGTKIQADWTAVTGATGYRIEWNTANSGWGGISPTQKANVSGGSTVTHEIDPTPALTANTRYYVRVIATKATADDSVPSDVSDTKTTSGAGAGDYDADNDGLIEVSNLAQLNAIRWGPERRRRAGDRHFQLRGGLPRRRGQHGLQRVRRDDSGRDGQPAVLRLRAIGESGLRHQRRQANGRHGRHLLERRQGLAAHRQQHHGLHRRVPTARASPSPTSS